MTAPTPAPLAVWTDFGGVLTPASWWNGLQGLTISVDYGKLDIRGFQTILDPHFIVAHESSFPGLVTRDPSQGNRIVLVRSPEQNVGRFIENVDFRATKADPRDPAIDTAAVR